MIHNVDYFSPSTPIGQVENAKPTNEAPAADAQNPKFQPPERVKHFRSPLSGRATITCPNCHKPFDLTDTIEQPILEKQRKKITAEQAKKAEEAVITERNQFP